MAMEELKNSLRDALIAKMGEGDDHEHEEEGKCPECGAKGKKKLMACASCGCK